MQIMPHNSKQTSTNTQEHCLNDCAMKVNSNAFATDANLLLLNNLNNNLDAVEDAKRFMIFIIVSFFSCCALSAKTVVRSSIDQVNDTPIQNQHLMFIKVIVHQILPVLNNPFYIDVILSLCRLIVANKKATFQGSC
uniref:Transmembrane protein n=1 Tax=Glossina austeni TaxID=7395 RepID=A0A1A9VA80_GLOAU